MLSFNLAQQGWQVGQISHQQWFSHMYWTRKVAQKAQSY
jgi:hypothetical protein